MTTPTTVEVVAILLGYLMLGEKSSAHEITGALADWRTGDRQRRCC
jgi:hypothetical protein